MNARKAADDTFCQCIACLRSRNEGAELFLVFSSQPRA